jgi:hypothetical protein
MLEITLLLKNLAKYLETKEELTTAEFEKLSHIFNHLARITILSKETHSENLSIYLHKPVTTFTGLKDLEEKLWEAYIDLRNDFIRLKVSELLTDVVKVLGWSGSKEPQEEIEELIELIREAFYLNEEV